MGDALGLEIKSLYEREKSNRHNWDQHWFEVAELVIPRRDQIFETRYKTKGNKKRRKQYDASAPHFLELLASALHSMLTNPSVQWFELTTGDENIDKDPAVRKWLQELVRKIHQILNNTNFQTEVHEVYMDLGSLGTSVLRIEEDNEVVIRFKSSPINEHQIVENYKGEVDGIFTENIYTIRQAVQKFGEDVFKNNHELKNILKDDKDEISVIHAVIPRKDIKFGDKSPKSFKWASVHVHLDTGITLKESGFREFPYAVTRWNKSSGEKYGRSPSMKALPDIKMINSMMRDTIRAAQKVTDPPMFLPDEGIIGPINITPGGINYYRSGTPSIDGSIAKPFSTQANPGIGFDVMNDVRERIKQAYFIDQLQLREGPQMTATEVNQRTDEHLRLLGPILGRLHFELLKPLIARIISIMKRKNVLPPNMPDILGQANIDVFFSSQIAKAQRIAEGDSLLRVMNMIGPLIEMDPTTMDNIDSDAIVQYVSKINGLPQNLLKEPKEVEAIRQQRQEQAVKQQQQQDQLVAAETMNKAAPMLQQ